MTRMHEMSKQIRYLGMEHDYILEVAVNLSRLLACMAPVMEG